MKQPDIVDVAEKMLRGYYGHGNEQKKRIAAMGFDYDDVLKECERVKQKSLKSERSF